MEVSSFRDTSVGPNLPQIFGKYLLPAPKLAYILANNEIIIGRSPEGLRKPIKELRAVFAIARERRKNGNPCAFGWGLGGLSMNAKAMDLQLWILNM